MLSTSLTLNTTPDIVNIHIHTESVFNPIMFLVLPSSCGSNFHNSITDHVKIYFLLLVLSLA